MPDRSSSHAEAAYRRALSAYQQGAYDEALRLAREALTFDPAHGAATALLGRLGTRGMGPQVVSTDPTVLISRSGESLEPESPDPTVIVPRNMPRPAAPRAERTRPPTPPPPRSTRGRAAEPTVIVEPNSDPRSARGRPKTTGSLWQRLWPSAGPAAQTRRSPNGSASIWTPGGRGFLIVLGAVTLAALVVWGGIRGVQWAWPSGEALTVDLSEGGTIEGPGIRCGGGVSRCSTTVATNEQVELTPKAAAGYEFAGFTGDCEASGGRLLMDTPKRCGARFERREGPVGTATFTLTIDKPTGGTITAPGVGGDIECGVLGSICKAQVPAGETVNLKVYAADGYAFDSFSPDCTGGEFVMNAARTCGAAFIPTATPLVNNPVRAPEPPEPTRRTAARPQPEPPAGAPTSPTPAQPPLPAQPVSSSSAVNQPGGGTPSGASGPPVAVVQDKPAPPPESMEEHATKQIEQRVKDYCAEQETLKAERVRPLFRADVESQWRATFKEYRSLVCTVAGKPEILSLDAEKGVAKVKFEMKQTLQMKSGGAPKTNETIVTLHMGRRSLRSEWLILDMETTTKPK